MARIKTPLGLRPTGLDPKALFTEEKMCSKTREHQFEERGPWVGGPGSSGMQRERNHRPTWALVLAVVSANKALFT